MAVSFFTYDGVCSRAYNLYITGDKVHSAPERDIERISVPGRDGDLLIDNGRWKNQTVEFSCFFRAVSGDAALYAKKIKSWLLSPPTVYRHLELSCDPEYFRLAAFHDSLEIDTAVRRYGKLKIAFDCKPFRYRKDGQLSRDITEVKQIVNPESFDSLPYIKITGNGDIRLSVGEGSWLFSQVAGWIELDSALQNVYQGNQPQNSKKTGVGYPTLAPGKNVFAWEGNVTKVEVVPRWQTL